MAWGIGNLFKAMKDDKGLFQGGEEGRMFGRAKDRLGGRGTSYDPSMAEDQDLWGHAKDFAKNIDVESSDDVRELQSLMNQLGITDEEGGSFEEDAILGSKTMQGLRQLQGRDDQSYRKGPWASEEWAEEPGGGATSSWTDWLFGKTPGQKSASARDELFDRSYSTDEAGYPMAYDQFTRKK